VNAFDDYQKKAWDTAIYPERGDNLIYPVLGLNGEAGEVAEKVKKVIRDSEGVVGEATRKILAKELGDVLWYVAAICSELGLSMAEVADQNLDKLNDRKERGVLHGSGDER
jgi:NTP pyrophosphatase (non-canonical NTP hydrolase)